MAETISDPINLHLQLVCLEDTLKWGVEKGDELRCVLFTTGKTIKH